MTGDAAYAHWREHGDAESAAVLDDSRDHAFPTLSVPCPVCKVPAGQPCITPLAYRMPHPHHARVAEQDDDGEA